MGVVSAWFIVNSTEVIWHTEEHRYCNSSWSINLWALGTIVSFFPSVLKVAATMWELGALERSNQCSSVAYGLGVKFILKKKKKNQNGFVIFQVLAETSGL